MKKKVIAIITVICVIIASISVGIILVNMSIKEDTKVDKNTNDSVIQEEDNINTSDEAKKVVLDSKIGNEVLSKLLFPNVYSKALYNELDKNGVSNDFKIMYTFSIISIYEEYSNYLRQGEDYIGNYITKDDLEKVASNLFYNSSGLKHKAVFNDNNTYNKEKENYVVVARGYFESEYIVEIPYEIYEYSDKLEVKSYRLYIKRIGNMTEELDETRDEIYYDKSLSKLATKTTDEKMFDESEGQQDVLKYKIETGEIDKEKLDKTTWTFKKKDGKYLIEDYKVD